MNENRAITTIWVIAVIIIFTVLALALVYGGPEPTTNWDPQLDMEIF